MQFAFEVEHFCALEDPTRGLVPVDLYPILDSLNADLDQGLGTIDVDAGKGLCELICAEPRTLTEAVEVQQYVLEHMYRAPQLLYAQGVFEMSAPWIESVNPARMWNEKERYFHLREGVRRESEYGALLDHTFSVRASMHINVNVDPCSPAGLLTLSILNNVSPYLADRLGERHGIDTEELLGIWRWFARAERFSSAELWFGDAQSLERQLAGIPRLLECIDRKIDGWRVDLDSPSGFHDPVSLGTIWWDVRPKEKEEGERYIECRFSPTMSPNTPQFKAWVEDIGNIISEIGEIAEKGGGYDTKESATPVFSRLHKRFPDLMPERALTTAERDGCASRIPPSYYSMKVPEESVAA